VIPFVGLMVLAVGLDYRFFANQAGLLSFSLEELISYAVAFFLLLEVLIQLQRGGWQAILARLRSNWLVAAYAAWVFLCSVTILLVRGDVDGLHYLKDLVPGIVFYAAVTTWTRTERDVDSLVGYTRIMLCVLALMAVSQGIMGGPYPNPLDENAFYKLRISGEEKVDNPVVGTFGSPNAFAVFFGPLMLLALTFRNLRSRIVGVALPWPKLAYAFLLIAALFLTQAKMAWGIAMLALLGWLAARAARISPSRRAILVGLATVLVISAGIVAVLGSLESTLPPGLTLANLRGRSGLALEAIGFLGRDPISAAFGGGMQLYQEAMPVLFGVHNEYLHQGLMWGVVGLLLFTTLLVRGTLRASEVDWSVALPLGVLGTVFMVESAGGNQLQSLTFYLLGFTEAIRRVRLASRIAGGGG
jgi:hypothetical protein